MTSSEVIEANHLFIFPTKNYVLSSFLFVWLLLPVFSVNEIGEQHQYQESKTVRSVIGHFYTDVMCVLLITSEFRLWH
jgi:hypothetical protein